MRLISLDLLRGVAVLLVLVRHLAQGKANDGLNALVDGLYHCPDEWLYLPVLALRSLHRCGWMGVDLFFVLSGFLVSGLLFREHRQHGEIRLGRFLVRRGFKIYPAFYVFLALSLAGIVLFTQREVTGAAVACELLFLQNYGPSVWGQTWSLAVEEHFYLLLGVLLLVLSRRPVAQPFACLPVLFLLTAGVSLMLRLSTSLAEPEFDHKVHVFPTHLRLDALLFGVLLAYYWHLQPERLAWVARARRPVLLLSGMLIAPALLWPQGDFFMRTFGLSLLYLGFGGVLLAALPGPGASAQTGVGSALVARIGLDSYSIYLWHAPVLIVGVPLFVRLTGGVLGTGGELAVYFVGSIGLGMVMAKLVEWPVLQLRERWFPSRSGQLQPGSAAAPVRARGRATQLRLA